MDLYRSNRVEQLLDPLAELMATPAGGIMDPDVLVVHSKGMERWLSMQLAQRLGICAHVEFPFPGAVVQDVVAAALGDELSEGLQRWKPGPLAFTVLAALEDGLLDQPQFSPIHGYVADDPRGLKRFQLAQRLARTFDRYTVFRPDVVLGWERGAEPNDWQAMLWRAVAERIGTDHMGRLQRRLLDALLRRDVDLDALAPRYVLFGITTLPPLYLDILARLSRHRHVAMFLLSPSQEYWAHVRSKREIARSLFDRPSLTAEAMGLELGHPLLASLGRLGRDFQLLVEDLPYQEPRPDLFTAPPTQTTLGRLQADILTLQDRSLDDDPWPLDPADASISIHACHGPLRQVQVLHDQLLQAFSDTPDLQPRDVVVLLPDVEHWAPLVRAVFDRDAEDPRHLPFRVSDRFLRRDNPVAQALLTLLGMVRGRAEASRVLDLLALEPVRKRFELEPDDLERITQWVGDAGIRWGIDAAHRAEHDQPADPANTWRFGLDRLLLGVAMRGDGSALWQGALPYDEVEGGISAVLGRFVDFAEQLFASLRALQRPRPVAEWETAIAGLLERLLYRDEDTAWQHLQVIAAMEANTAAAEAAELERPLQLEPVLSLLTDVFEESAPASGFLSGQITFCAMVPMRTIPFRVVCMLGMDEQAFPRVTQGLGFDRMASAPRPGDRQPREDDRYLFLEALLSARDRVVLTYTGLSIVDNKELPPSVVVAELLDGLSGAFLAPGQDAPTPESNAAAVRRALVVRHPLQPFSPRNFGADPEPRLFGFSQPSAAAARRLQQRAAPPEPFFGPRELPAPDPLEVVTLDHLVRVFRMPLEFLLRDRLGLRLVDERAQVQDREPIELSALELYQVASPLLGRSLQGEALDHALASVQALGVLPLGVPGRVSYEHVTTLVEPLSSKVRSLQADPLPACAVDLELGGQRLQGHVDGLNQRGRLLFGYARIKQRDLVAHWIRHLALNAAGQPTTTRIVGRPSRGGGVGIYRLLPVREPKALLADLMELAEAARRLPLLFFPDTSMVWKRKAGDRGSPAQQDAADRSASVAWVKYNPLQGWRTGDGTNPYVIRVLGDLRPWDQGVRDRVPVPHGLDFRNLADRVAGPLRAHLRSGA